MCQSLLFSRLHLNKKATDKQPYSKLPGVSLLKPLKGVDPNLINNLETFFELDYPKVSTVLFSLEMEPCFVSPMVTEEAFWYRIKVLKMHDVNLITFMLW